jgi:hypothetical protein
MTTVSKSVTRLEIADAVGGVFETGGCGRDSILAAAVEAESRPELIEVLRTLPERRYVRLNQLWEELYHIPVGA